MTAAVMNAAELDHLSPSACVFQFWYIAKHRNIFSSDFEPAVRANGAISGPIPTVGRVATRYGIRSIDVPAQSSGRSHHMSTKLPFRRRWVLCKEALLTEPEINHRDLLVAQEVFYAERAEIHARERRNRERAPNHSEARQTNQKVES
jgi:hypothetical protein